MSEQDRRRECRIELAYVMIQLPVSDLAGIVKGAFTSEILSSLPTPVDHPLFMGQGLSPC